MEIGGGFFLFYICTVGHSHPIALLDWVVVLAVVDVDHGERLEIEAVDSKFGNGANGIEGPVW